MKPIIRIATEEDKKHNEENKKKMDAYRKMSTPVKGADFNKLQKELADEKFEDSYFDTNSQGSLLRLGKATEIIDISNP